MWHEHSKAENKMKQQAMIETTKEMHKAFANDVGFSSSIMQHGNAHFLFSKIKRINTSHAVVIALNAMTGCLFLVSLFHPSLISLAQMSRNHIKSAVVHIRTFTLPLSEHSKLNKFDDDTSE